MSAPPEFDPFDARFFEDPYPAYRELRAHHPVYRREIAQPRVWPHYWMLSRARDVDAALSDWQTFSSARGTLVDTDVSLIPPNIFHMDPPRHDALRAILARALTPKRVAELEPRVKACADDLLAGLVEKGSFDAATDYAQLIPTLTMCELLDLPKIERAQFLAWNLATLAGADFTSPAALRAYAEMADYWRALVAERRSRPGGDLISQLLTHQAGDPELSDEEVSGFCSLLLDASQNTTMNTISNAILARALTPKRVAELEPRVKACADDLLAGLVEKGSFDAATDYAQLIPTLTMCELLDLPKSERAQFLAWNLATLAGADFTSPAALRAYAEMADYWRSLVAERRRQPGADLISQLLSHQAGDPELSDEEVSGFCSLLLDASQNTTMNTISNAILALGRTPDQRRKVVADPARWPRAVEELLRWISPVQGLARATTRDVTLHGVTIPAGDQVLLLYGSANHDEAVFADADLLDLDRDVRAHWAFGHGVHHCLGSAVARIETRVALAALAARIPDWDVIEAGVVRNQLVPTRGVAHAPIEFAPAR